MAAIDRLPSVSVLVPTYCREQMLCDTLECLFRQDYPHMEILVVDQTPEHEPHVAAFLAHAQNEALIRYIHLDSPSSPRSRNIGVRMASGELILLADDDILVEPGWVSAHVRHFDDPRVGAVIGRIVYPPRLDLGMVGRPTAVFLRNGTCTAGFGRSEPAYIDTGGGGNMSVYRQLYLEVGGYDELYVGNAFREESDFALRLRRAGYLIYFAPDAEIIHLKASAGGHRVASPGAARQFRDNIENETRFFLKNFPHRDLPRFLWRFRRELLLPAPRLAWRNRRLADAFPAQIGLWRGLTSYVKRPGTYAGGLVGP